jgi:hypothetical protein
VNKKKSLKEGGPGEHAGEVVRGLAVLEAGHKRHGDRGNVVMSLYRLLLNLN